jgi:type I restriction enzyme, S subunit
VSELPDGWTTAVIEDVFGPLSDGRTLHQGWSPRCEKVPSGSDEVWGVLKTTAIQPGIFHPEHNKALPTHLASRPVIEVQPGDLLITCAGPRSRCGVSCLVAATRPRLMLSGKMYRFRVAELGIDRRFVAFYLQTAEAWAAIDRMKTGGNESGLNLTHDRFRRLKIPLAPTAEQKRIVAVIDEQFSRLDAAIASVERVKQHAIQMRSALIGTAVSGKLVPQDSHEEPAVDWLSGHGKVLVDREVDHGLPKRWARVTIGQLKMWSLYGPRFTSDDYVSAGTPVLRTTDITQSGKILATQAPKLDLNSADLEKYRVHVGDLLITRTGSIGRVAFIADETPAIPGAYLILYRFGLPVEFTEFLFFVLRSSRIQRELVGRSAGIGRPNLNAPSIDSIVVDIPPFAELQRILDKAKQMLSTIDALEATLDVAATRANHLRLSILRAAFAGRLARQDPDDEPATVLLEHIAAERVSSNGHKAVRIPRPEASSPDPGDAGLHERRMGIQLMWEDGYSKAEIAETMEISSIQVGSEMTRMRREGWDLPKRDRRTTA